MLATKLKHAFVVLEQTPFRHPNIKRLQGRFAGQFRYRADDWRVIYSVNVADQAVVVTVILHRREAYQ